MLPQINGQMRINTMEARYTQSGTMILTLSLVSSTKYKTQSGEQKEDTCWVDGKAFGKQAEIIQQYFNEKDVIIIYGELKQEQWTTQDGQKRSKHTIKIDKFDFPAGRSKSDTQCQPQSNYAQPQQNQQQGYPVQHENADGKVTQQYQGGGTPQGQQNQSSVPEIVIDPDEIPF